MSESLFLGFFNNSQPFGLNVRVPEKTLQQIGQTVGNTAGGVLEPLFTYLEENENVFNGDITTELNKARTETFNTQIVLNAVDEKVNGIRPRFDAKF